MAPTQTAVIAAVGQQPRKCAPLYRPSTSSHVVVTLSPLTCNKSQRHSLMSETTTHVGFQDTIQRPTRSFMVHVHLLCPHVDWGAGLSILSQVGSVAIVCVGATVRREGETRPFARAHNAHCSAKRSPCCSQSYCSTRRATLLAHLTSHRTRLVCLVGLYPLPFKRDVTFYGRDWPSVTMSTIFHFVQEKLPG